MNIISVKISEYQVRTGVLLYVMRLMNEIKALSDKEDYERGRTLVKTLKRIIDSTPALENENVRHFIKNMEEKYGN